MVNSIFIKNIIGWGFVITAYFDAIKYYWMGKKIRDTGTAKSQSRKSINVAILNDIFRILYGIIIKDFFIISTSLFALICMCYCWWEIYWFYPYKQRGLINFKKPNILLYFWNSITPNKIRKRL